MRGNGSYRVSFQNLKLDIKNNFIISGLVPTLEMIAIIKVSILLWQINVPNLNNLYLIETQEDKFKNLEKSMQKLKNELIEKVSSLELAIYCKEDLKIRINLTGMEIMKFFFSQDPICFASFDSLKIYFNNICWTREGKINTLKTALKLVDHTNLSDEDKYIIACNNCLIDKIKSLKSSAVPCTSNELVTLVQNVTSSSAVRCTSNELVTFWTNSFFIRKREPSEPVNFGLLLKWAIVRNLDVAVQFLWENYADESVKEDLEFLIAQAILELYRNSYSSSNILLYLYKQETGFKTKPTNRHVSWSLLRLIDDLTILCKFRKPKCLFDVIETNNICYSLRGLTKSWYARMFGLDHYKEYFNDLLLRFRSEIKSDFILLCKEFLYEAIITYKDMITAKLLLTFGSTELKQEFLYSPKGMSICFNLKNSGRPICLIVFVNEILDSEEERIYFLETFLPLKYRSHLSDFSRIYGITAS